MAESGRPTCASCPHWRRDAILKTYGECRAHPPPLESPGKIKVDGKTAEFPEGSWRFTGGAHDWCGEHPGMAAWVAANFAPKEGPP